MYQKGIEHIGLALIKITKSPYQQITSDIKERQFSINQNHQESVSQREYNEFYNVFSINQNHQESVSVY